ncbi:MAG: hypothetical protein ACRD3I_07905 [Terriglobales bacterium]
MVAVLISILLSFLLSFLVPVQRGFCLPFWRSAVFFLRFRLPNGFLEPGPTALAGPEHDLTRAGIRARV